MANFNEIKQTKKTKNKKQKTKNKKQKTKKSKKTKNKKNKNMSSQLVDEIRDRVNRSIKYFPRVEDLYHHLCRKIREHDGYTMPALVKQDIPVFMGKFTTPFLRYTGVKHWELMFRLNHKRFLMVSTSGPTDQWTVWNIRPRSISYQHSPKGHTMLLDRQLFRIKIVNVSTIERCPELCALTPLGTVPSLRFGSIFKFCTDYVQKHRYNIMTHNCQHFAVDLVHHVLASGVSAEINLDDEILSMINVGIGVLLCLSLLLLLLYHHRSK